MAMSLDLVRQRGVVDVGYKLNCPWWAITGQNSE